MTVLMGLMLLPGLVVGLTFHEFAHAWSASLLGDDFARRQGRVSLNPFRHLSLVGTLAVFVLPIGWAKPVPVNLYNFARPKRDYLLTSLAGPAANLIVVGLCLLLMQWTGRANAAGILGVSVAGLSSAFTDLAHAMLMMVALINTILAVINLLPIPPLDGSKIWPCLIPGLKPSFKPKTTWVFIILLIVLIRANALSPIIDFAVSGMSKLMPMMPTAALAPVDDLIVEVDDLIAEADALLAEADAAIEARDLDEAEARCTEALRLDPESVVALECRVSVRSRQANWPGALADMDRLIALRPWPVAEDHKWRASVLEYLNRPEEGAAAREMAQSLGATDVEPVDTGDQ